MDGFPRLEASGCVDERERGARVDANAIGQISERECRDGVERDLMLPGVAGVLL